MLYGIMPCILTCIQTCRSIAVAASKGKSSASGGAQPASAPGERPKSSNTSRATSIKRGKPLPEVPSAQSRTLAGQSDAGFVPEDAPIVPRRRQPSPISSGGKRKSLPNSLRQLVAQHGEMTGSDGSQCKLIVLFYHTAFESCSLL